MNEWIQEHAVMFSEANAAILGVTHGGTQIIVPVFHPNPVELKEEFQQLLTMEDFE